MTTLKDELTIPVSPKNQEVPISSRLLPLFILVVYCWLDLPPNLVWPNQGGLLGTGLAILTTSDGVTIFAEVADTPNKRAKGLMFRPTMAPDHGMLFKFPESGHWTFWMKNTKLPLDILWLNGKGVVVHIESHVPICTRTDDGCPRYHSKKKSLYVLEMKAGMADQLGIREGSQLSIAFPRQVN